MSDLPIAVSKVSPSILLYKQNLQVPVVKKAHTSLIRSRADSGQSSICKFAPKHTDSESLSPFKGAYQHMQTNEELVSANEVS